MTRGSLRPLMPITTWRAIVVPRSMPEASGIKTVRMLGWQDCMERECRTLSSMVKRICKEYIGTHRWVRIILSTLTWKYDHILISRYVQSRPEIQLNFYRTRQISTAISDLYTWNSIIHHIKGGWFYLRILRHFHKRETFLVSKLTYFRYWEMSILYMHCVLGVL